MLCYGTNDVILDLFVGVERLPNFCFYLGDIFGYIYTEAKTKISTKIYGSGIIQI